MVPPSRGQAAFIVRSESSQVSLGVSYPVVRAGRCMLTRSSPAAGKGSRSRMRSVCLAVAITHSPPIEVASAANMAALPATRAMTPVTSASAPMPDTSTT